MPKKNSPEQSQRAKAYDWAMRVLCKRHYDEFKELYAKILKEEFGLDTAGAAHKQISKYVQETK